MIRVSTTIANSRNEAHELRNETKGLRRENNLQPCFSPSQKDRSCAKIRISPESQGRVVSEKFLRREFCSLNPLDANPLPEANFSCDPLLIPSEKKRKKPKSWQSLGGGARGKEHASPSKIVRFPWNIQGAGFVLDFERSGWFGPRPVHAIKRGSIQFVLPLYSCRAHKAGGYILNLLAISFNRGQLRSSRNVFEASDKQTLSSRDPPRRVNFAPVTNCEIHSHFSNFCLYHSSFLLFFHSIPVVLYRGMIGLIIE